MRDVHSIKIVLCVPYFSNHIFLSILYVTKTVFYLDEPTLIRIIYLNS